MSPELTSTIHRPSLINIGMKGAGTNDIEQSKNAMAVIGSGTGVRACNSRSRSTALPLEGSRDRRAGRSGTHAGGVIGGIDSQNAPKRPAHPLFIVEAAFASDFIH